MQHFFTLVADGKVTTKNFQAFLANPNGFVKDVKKEKFSSFVIAAKYGYTVVEDVEPSQFKVKNLKFITFLESGESYITGETMRQRAVTLKGNIGLVDGQYLLDHQDEIPKEMRGKYIVFPGTLLRGSGDDLDVAYLSWLGFCWVLSFGWLGTDWGGSDRFARCE